MGTGNKKITPQGMSQPGEVSQLQLNESLTNELRTDSDARSDYLAYIQDRDGVCGGNHVMLTGSDVSTKVRMSGTIRYRIDGIEYSATVVEGAFSNTGQVDIAKFGAWRFLMGKTGAITTQSATAAGTGAQVHESAEQALASLAQLAPTADTVEIGYLVIQADGANPFIPNTDNPTVGHANVDLSTYYSVHVARLDNGFTADPSVGLSEGTTDSEFAFGTINVRTNGLNIAQISADVTIVFTQSDTIAGTTKFGGHLFITNTAGSGILSLTANGVLKNSTTEMTYASAEAAVTALDAAQAALPLTFSVIGRMVLDSMKSTFTYNSDSLDGVDGAPTWTDEVAEAFDRTVVSGTGVGNAPPTIPPATTAAALDLVG